MASGQATNVTKMGVAVCSVTLLCLSATTASWADAIGPSTIAKSDRQLWPESIDSLQGFDKASRAAILIYALSLQEKTKMTNEAMLTTFKINSVNHSSVEKWLNKEEAIALKNYQYAASNCTSSDWTCIHSSTNFNELIEQAAIWNTHIPTQYASWKENLNGFTNTYTNEQLRLAALFPKVSSEIDFFNTREWNGDALPDRQFFLTFDDGPTNVAGNTDNVMAMLAANQKTAVFFTLGENFQARLKKSDPQAMVQLYKGQCVASHGWEHQSHAKWDKWQDSIIRTKQLLNATLNSDNGIAATNASVLPLFRPPYGQRLAESGEFFQAQSIRVALWNVDSQDWNHNVSEDNIVNRIITLMLIKRHGVMLFHDIHNKAKTALPAIFKSVGESVSWGPCQDLTKL